MEDREVSRLILSSLLAVLIVGCGVLPSGSSDSAIKPDGSDNSESQTSQNVTSSTLASTTSTVATVATTSTTAGTPQSIPEGDVAVPQGDELLTALGLQPGVPIDAPGDFPPLSDLEAMLENPFHGPEHDRARISSRIEILLSPEEAEAVGIDLVLLDQAEITITYFDGIKVWDYPGGYREVSLPDGELLFLDQDGTWKESSRFEWPPGGPLGEWRFAQSMASDRITESEALGYEMLADIPTLRLHWFPSPDDTTGDEAVGWTSDVWLDATGTVIRLVTGAPADGIPIFLIWDIETLSPKLTGPLPHR